MNKIGLLYLICNIFLLVSNQSFQGFQLQLTIIKIIITNLGLL